MRIEYDEFGCQAEFEGDVEAVLQTSVGTQWCGLGFNDIMISGHGRVRLAQRGVQFGLSLKPHQQTYVCAGKTYCFRSDNVAVLEPGTSVIGTWTGPFRNLTLKIAPETVERISDVSLARIGIRTQFLPTRSREVVGHLLHAVSADIAGGCPNGAMLVESVAATLLRIFSTSDAEGVRPAPHLSSADAALLRDLIATHLAEPIDLSRLATAAGISIGHLVRAFKASFGMTPYHYILRNRVLRAQELIENGASSLSEVSRLVGFRDPSQMSKTFRNIIGTTPRHIRRISTAKRTTLEK